MKKKSRRHPFKASKSLVKDSVDKEKLRRDVKNATIEYLKTNKIQYQSNSPNAKIRSVGIRDLGSYSDSAEFYYLEESLETNY
tara:strand:+ start:4923 stop:5171 length:249 start_codon:yes stop_codon:yes gene_type:complete